MKAEAIFPEMADAVYVICDGIRLLRRMVISIFQKLVKQDVIDLCEFHLRGILKDLKFPSLS